MSPNQMPSPLGQTATSNSGLSLGQGSGGDWFARLITDTIPVRVVNMAPIAVSIVGTTAASGSGVKTHAPIAGASIVPTRIINTNPIRVEVVNFPKVPPPLPGLTAGAMPPPLPTPPVKQFQSIFDKMPRQLEGLFGRGSSAGRFAEKFAMKNGVGGSAGAGAVGLAAGAAVAVLDQLKTTFVDPLIQAARGGFQAGVNRGMGVDSLARSFEVLGVAIGVQLLPTVIEVSSTVLAFSTQVENATDVLGQLAKVAFPLVTALGGSGDKKSWLSMSGLGGIMAVSGVKKEDGLAAGISRVFTMFTNIGGWGRIFSGKHVMGEPKDLNREERQGQIDLLKDLRDSLGPRASYAGVTDVRQQAQLAALESPLERRMREMILKQLDKMEGKDWLTWLQDIAKNTAAAAGQR